MNSQRHLVPVQPNGSHLGRRKRPLHGNKTSAHQAWRCALRSLEAKSRQASVVANDEPSARRECHRSARPGGVGHYLTMSFSDLSGRMRTTLRAGFALNIISCPVNGLMPLRGLVAGLCCTVIFIRPGTANTPGPFLPTFLLISSDKPSSTFATSFRESS